MTILYWANIDVNSFNKPLGTTCLNNFFSINSLIHSFIENKLKKRLSMTVSALRHLLIRMQRPLTRLTSSCQRRFRHPLSHSLLPKNVQLLAKRNFTSLSGQQYSCATKSSRRFQASLKPAQASLNVLSIRNQCLLTSDQRVKTTPFSNQSPVRRFSTDFQQKFETELEACRKAHQENDWDAIEARKKELDACVNEKGLSILMAAIDRGELALAEELVKRGIAIHSRDLQGNTSLHHAVRKQAHTLTQRLFEHIKIDTPNRDGQTALHVAAEYGYNGIVSDLLINGADVNACATVRIGSAVFTKVTPLHLAVMKGHQNIVESFAKRGHQLNWDLEVQEVGNILHLAIHFHHYRILGFCLTTLYEKTQHLVSKTNPEGSTPIMLAASLGDTMALRILQGKGAPLDARNRQGRTALHLAALEGHRNAINLLCRYGCDLTAVDNDNKRPVDLVDENTSARQSLKNYLINLQQQRTQLDQQPDLLSFIPENIVFQGGGAKGIAFVGAVQVLEKEKRLIDLLRVAGTSAGAIQATLLALEYSAKEMLALLDTDFSTFLDHPLSKERVEQALKGASDNKIATALSALKKIFKTLINPTGVVSEALKGLWETTGLCDGESFRKWIEGLIAEKTGIPHCTFGQLKKLIDEGKPFKHLHIFTSNLSTRKPCHMSSEDPAWADVIISDAVRASMSIPGVFKPHELWILQDGQRTQAPHFGKHIDGGVFNNFPLDTFDKRKYLPSNPSQGRELHVKNRRTLGFSFFSPNTPTHFPSETVGDLLKGIVDMYLAVGTMHHEHVYENQFRVIHIDNQDLPLSQFNPSPKQKKLLLEGGLAATRKFYKRHDSFIQGEDSLYLQESLVQQARGAIRLNRPHPHFTGRTGFLESLHKELIAQDKSIIQVIIYGPPGFGKTETALAFANRFMAEFSLIWFIESQTPEKMHQAYRELADHLEVHYNEKTTLAELQSKVHDCLETATHPMPFLLIYDNAEEMPIVPQRGNGRILITSRRRLSPSAQEIPPLTQAEAILLVEKILKQPSNSEMVELVTTLDCFPLALTQMASYILETPGMTVQNCLALLKQRLEAVLKSVRPDSHYPLSFLASCQITEASLKQTNPYAMQWLQVCSYLDPDHIPTSWIETWLEDEIEDPIQRQLKKHDILRSLSEYALIRYDGKRETISLHRLRQHAMRSLHMLKDHYLYNSLLTAANGLIAKLARIHDPEIFKHWKALSAWAPHAVDILNHALRFPRFDLDFVTISTVLGKWFYKQGEFSTALKYLKEALRVLNESAGPLEEMTIILNLLGEISTTTGNYKEAKEYYEQTLKVQKTLYKDGPRLEISLSYRRLAEILYSLKNHQEATEYLQQAEAIQTILYKNSLYSDANTLNHLRSTYQSLNDYRKAKEYAKQVLAMKIIAYGNEPHEQIVDSIFKLGKVLKHLKEYEESKQHIEEALIMLQGICKNEPHPHIAVLLYELGSIWLDLKNYKKAKKYHEEALNVRTIVYENKPQRETAASLFALGGIWENLKDRHKAKDYYHRSLTMYKTVYRNQPHPNTVASLLSLQKICRELGHLEEAEKYAKKAKEMQALLPPA